MASHALEENTQSLWRLELERSVSTKGAFIHGRHGLTAVIGTHPIPQKYFLTHQTLGTWDSPEWQGRIKHVVKDAAAGSEPAWSSGLEMRKRSYSEDSEYV